MIGKTLAHYEITALLGEGGMGAVYRATDTKLGREVALKVLTGLADHGPERIARFQQEARTIAALNHPNIVTLHAVEEADGIPFLIMELVDGVRLTQRMPNDGLELDDILRLAIPMADAVSAAHRQGITHRDLKPDNVMIDAEGRVKVLDFGLAKLLDEAEGDDDATRTIAVHKTAEGRILGTAAYMSPEQAEGKPVDARSDVFSLGILLYEMATGRKPFDGETAISMISSIVKEQPKSALEINRALPRHLGRILDRCLTKDPERRYQSAIELRNELELLDRESKSGELEMWVPSSATAARRDGRPGIPVAMVVVALVVVIAGTFLATRSLRTDAVPTGPRATAIEPLTTQGTVASYPSLSPAGDLFAYEANEGNDRDVFVQRIGGRRPINLTADHPGLDRRPAISPDGQRIAFESSRDGGGIFVMGTTGEAVRRVADRGHDPAWSPDGRRLVITSVGWFNPSGRNAEGVLSILDLEDGTLHAITPDSMDAVQPDWSPDGSRIVFWGVRDETGQRDIYSIGADGTGLVRLTDDAALDYSPRYAPDGRSVWFTSNRAGTFNLWRIPIDPTTGEPNAESEPFTLPNDEIARFDFEGDRIVFAAPDADQQAVRVDLPTGPDEAARVRAITRGSLQVQLPMVSPDGRRVVFGTPIGTGNQDLFLAEAATGAIRRLTDDAFRDRGAAWHPSGDRIVFYTDRSGAYEVWSMRPDGSNARQISDVAARGMDSQWYPRYAHDGSMLSTLNEGGTHVWTVDPQTAQLLDPRPLVAPDGGSFYVISAWHPLRRAVIGWTGDVVERRADGLWTHDLDDGTWTLLVERLDRDWHPSAWSRDGETVYIVDGGRSALLAFDVADAPLHSLDDPRVRYVAPNQGSGSVSMTTDGTWLVMAQSEFSSEIWGVTLGGP